MDYATVPHREKHKSVEAQTWFTCLKKKCLKSKTIPYYHENLSSEKVCLQTGLSGKSPDFFKKYKFVGGKLLEWSRLNGQKYPSKMTYPKTLLTINCVPGQVISVCTNIAFFRIWWVLTSFWDKFTKISSFWPPPKICTLLRNLIFLG